MNTACKIVGAIALVTVVAGPLAAQEKIKEGAANTKDAVVKGAKVGGNWLPRQLTETLVG
jgi:hypothetical protein